MKVTTSIQGLEEQIEQLVREHLLAARAAAASAVARAFGESATRATLCGRTNGTRAPRAAGRRRTKEEIAELAERFCRAVQASPGEGMTTLCAKIGASSPELTVAVSKLRQAGRVRSVGSRHQTKYFPAAKAAAA